MSDTGSDWTVEVFIEIRNTLGEGPISWRSRNLLAWVDILECRIHTATWSGQLVETIVMPEPVGCIFEMPDGSLIAGCQSGLRTVPSGELIARIPDASPDMRINDGKVDPWGNLVFGTMGFPEPRQEVGTLWRWDGHSFSPLLEGLTIPNGMVWENSGSDFLFIDTPTRAVRRFGYSPSTSEIQENGAALDLVEFAGVPDGMCDTDGGVMVAMWGGDCVLECKDVSKPRVITVPFARPTSVLRVPGTESFLITSASVPGGLGGDLFRLSPRSPV